MKAGFLAGPSGTFITKNKVSFPKLTVLEKVLLAAAGETSTSYIRGVCVMKLNKPTAWLSTFMHDFTGFFPTQTVFWWLFGFCDIYLERKISSVLKLFKSVFLFRPLIWYRTVHGLSSNAKELRTKQGISELQRGAVWGQTNPLGPWSLHRLREFYLHSLPTNCTIQHLYFIFNEGVLPFQFWFLNAWFLQAKQCLFACTVWNTWKKWSVGNGTKIAELTSYVL